MRKRETIEPACLLNLYGACGNRKMSGLNVCNIFGSIILYFIIEKLPASFRNWYGIALSKARSGSQQIFLYHPLRCFYTKRRIVSLHGKDQSITRHDAAGRVVVQFLHALYGVFAV